MGGLKEHYAALGRKFGYPVPLPEATLNQYVYRLLSQSRKDAAIAAFRRNVALHPESAKVYDSLGEALERDGRLEEARDNYRRAVARGEMAPDPNLAAFREHLRKLEATIQEKR